MNWPDEMVNELKGMVAQGMTAAECARCLNVSRNAVIGKAHRLGFAFRRMMRPGKPKATKLPLNEQTRVRRMATGGICPEPLPDMPDDDIPITQRVDLFGLTNATCRWPIGEPGSVNFYFCGHPSADMAQGRCYCSQHTQRAFARYVRPVAIPAKVS